MGNTQNTYPLEWLDLLITVTLNPTRTNLSAIAKAQVDIIISRASEESGKLHSRIMNEVFAITAKVSFVVEAVLLHSLLSLF